MTTLKEQKKIAKKLYGKGDIVEVDDTIFYKTKTASYRLDFDDTNKSEEYKRDLDVPPHSKKQNNGIESELTEEHSTEDITKAQVEQNYWHETDAYMNSGYKLDGSTLMMEKRISACVEAGGTQEGCSKEVKNRMKKAGSENTNTTDIEDVKDAQEETEETEKVDVCKEKLDFLEKFYEDNKEVETEKLDLESKYEQLKKDMEPIKKHFEESIKRKEKEIEDKVIQKKLDLSETYILPEETINEQLGDLKGEEALKQLDFMENWAKLVSNEEKTGEIELDAEDFKSIEEKALAKMNALYFHD